MKTLQKIIKKYSQVEFNIENYGIGGGLDNCKFASRRHENALCDEGKLTLGKACQIFKKATGLGIDVVKDVITYAIPNMEWHHAGKLPKQYGGGMKKTYFINSIEICDVASNWDEYVERLNLSRDTEKQLLQKERNWETKRFEFLHKHAKKIQRSPFKPPFFYLTMQEMNGKYGWFDSEHKSYNMPEYYSGWQFENSEKYEEFLNLK